MPRGATVEKPHITNIHLVESFDKVTRLFSVGNDECTFIRFVVPVVILLREIIFLLLLVRTLPSEMAFLTTVETFDVYRVFRVLLQSLLRVLCCRCKRRHRTVVCQRSRLFFQQPFLKIFQRLPFGLDTVPRHLQSIKS